MRSESIVKYLYWVIVAFVVASTIIGGAVRFSPVPFFDMWNGALEFYLDFQKTHDWNLWWAQHNEHRIVLARIFFWFDLKFFAGDGIFLILSNYSFLALLIFLFSKIIKDKFGESSYYLLPFSIAWLASWMQHENLIWGFQVQFWMAQIIPMFAFYFFYKSLVGGNRTAFFIFALCFGFLACGAMANGILVMPVLLLYAIYVKSGWRKCMVITALSAIEILLYFKGYSTPEHHGSLLHALKENPIGIFHYVFLYLGNPIVAILGNHTWTRLLAAIFGAGFIVVTIVIISRKFLKRNPISLVSVNNVLLCYILYMLATALGTAGGRLIFGVEQSLSSRYSTPVLIGWLALLIMISPKLQGKVSIAKIQYGLLAVMVAMLPIQVRAISERDSVRFDRAVSSIAIGLGIADVSQLNNLWPLTAKMLEIAGRAKQQKVTIFGSPQLVGLVGAVGSKTVDISTKESCRGYLDHQLIVDSAIEWSKLDGWFYASKMPPYVWIADKSGSIIGLGVTGLQRTDVSQALKIKVQDTGFKGYVISSKVGDMGYLVNPDDGCVSPIQFLSAGNK